MRVAEVVVDGRRFELQLKGYCRVLTASDRQDLLALSRSSREMNSRASMVAALLVHVLLFVLRGLAQPLSLGELTGAQWYVFFLQYHQHQSLSPSVFNKSF